MKTKNYYCTEWTLKEILNEEDLYKVRELINQGFDLISCDTETTGLHIILDKAFCITFAIVNLTTKLGKAFIVDIRNKTKSFKELLQSVLLSGKKLIFWNVKFDLHMLYNIGIDKLKDYENITDAMIYARLANDALTPNKGGVTLQLKAYSTRMLDPEAKTYEHQLAVEKKKILIERNNLLKDKGIKIGDLNKFLDDKINSIKDLPVSVQQILNNPKYNQNNYENIPWNILKRYAAFDAIFTIENYIRDLEVVKERDQLEVAKREEQLIPILWQMERYGFKLNVLYLKKAKLTMKDYIIEQRKRLNELVGQEIKIGQHALIKEIFRNKYHINLLTSDEDSLNQVHDGEAEIVAKIIIELRTLEKWYSTYICKWEADVDKTDRIYTSFNQCGTVSGRFSCDFQQFPKEPIYKNNGELLYSPRRIVMVSGNEYDMLALIDYSAEELRIQALYTILVGKPDLNLCRAYIPMNCFKNGEDYYLKENPTQKWHPTDLHTLTTLTAFPHITQDSPDFGHYRKQGKCTNFACNYGATADTLEKQFGFDKETANKLYNAYKTAFPGIQDYKEYVKNILKYQEYVTNLFGRRFYNCSWHNATNYLVQGSAADLLKIKLIELNNFLVSHNYKSRMLCTIHDEIMFEIHKDEHHIVPKLKEILQDVPNTKIPFIGDIEISTTTWDAKHKPQEGDLE